MTLLILLAILLLILPVAWLQRIMRRSLLFISALVLSVLCIHLLSVAGIFVLSVLRQ